MKLPHDQDEPVSPSARTAGRLRSALILLATSGVILATGAGLTLAEQSAGLQTYVALAGVGMALALFISLWEIARLRRITRAHALAMVGTNDGMWEWDPVSKELKVGKRLLNILGYADDFLGSTEQWIELVHPDDRAGYNEAVAAHL